MNVGMLRYKVGGLVAFTLVCVATLAYLFGLAGGNLTPLSDKYSVNALVPDALNIVINADVRRDGVTVGQVKKIESQGGASKLKMEIKKDEQIPLYRDASVRVRTKTLVGESYMDVNPGTKSAGELKSGTTLPLEAAEETVPLERILNSLDEPTRKEIRRNLKGIGGGLDKRGGKLNELFGALRPAVADTGDLVRALRPQRRELAALIGNTGVVLEAFGERTAALRGLVVDAKATAEAAASRDDRLRESIDELPATLARAQSSVARLARFSGKARPAFANLRTASVDLAPAVRDLGPAARDARTLFRELKPFLNAVDPVLEQLSPAADKLRTIAQPLDAFTRQASPAAEFLKGYAKEFGSFFAIQSSINDSPDAYGSRARVFAIAGKDSYANLSPEARRLADAFIEAGGLGIIGGTRTNEYPKSGTSEDPVDADGSYPLVEAKK